MRYTTLSVIIRALYKHFQQIPRLHISSGSLPSGCTRIRCLWCFKIGQSLGKYMEKMFTLHAFDFKYRPLKRKGWQVDRAPSRTNVNSATLQFVVEALLYMHEYAYIFLCRETVQHKPRMGIVIAKRSPANRKVPLASETKPLGRWHQKQMPVSMIQYAGCHELLKANAVIACLIHIPLIICLAILGWHLDL